MIRFEVKKEEDTATPMLESLSRDIPNINREILALIGEEVISIAQRDYLRGPRPEKLGRVSGQLARSLSYRLINDLEAEVGSNLPYAAIHEFGNEYMPERPYLRPSLDDVFNSGRAERIGERKLREEVNRRTR